MIDLPFDLPAFEPGSVWLVGAGPGDPGLVTLLAAHALAHADVVVHDALIGEAVLGLARPECERVFAGKRGGRPSPKQPDITEALIRLAREGKRVLRLKGGDPFTFGRGGEEALALTRAGIPFRVVPGVTAGIAGPAYAGIPITGRDTNSAVTFLTGHDAEGDLPADLDWEGIAKGSPVVVMYMALGHLDQIAGLLIAGGRDEGEPVALIARATTPDQKVLETTLGRAAEDARRVGLEAPAIVVVGPVVEMRRRLACS